MNLLKKLTVPLVIASLSLTGLFGCADNQKVNSKTKMENGKINYRTRGGKVTLRELAEKKNTYYGNFEIDVTSCCFYTRGLESDTSYNLSFFDKFSGGNIGAISTKLYSDNPNMVKQMVDELDAESRDGDDELINIVIKIQKTTIEESYKSVLLKGVTVRGKTYRF